MKKLRELHDWSLRTNLPSVCHHNCSKRRPSETPTRPAVFLTIMRNVPETENYLTYLFILFLLFRWALNRGETAVSHFFTVSYVSSALDYQCDEVFMSHKSKIPGRLPAEYLPNLDWFQIQHMMFPTSYSYVRVAESYGSPGEVLCTKLE